MSSCFLWWALEDCIGLLLHTPQSLTAFAYANKRSFCSVLLRRYASLQPTQNPLEHPKCLRILERFTTKSNQNKRDII